MRQFGMRQFGWGNARSKGGGGLTNVSDDFERDDTTAPVLGIPTSIRRTSPLPWAMYSSGMGAAVGGRISGGAYTASAGQVVYAVQEMSTVARLIRAIVSFGDGNGGSTNGTVSLLISPVGVPASEIIHNAIHVVLTRRGCQIEKLVNGVFTAVAGVTFSVSAAKDRRKLGFWMDLAADGSFTAEYASHPLSGSDAAFASLVGKYVTAEIFHNNGSMEALAFCESVDFGPAGGILANVGKNIVPNGGFSSDTLWAKSNFIITSGVAVHSAGSGGTIQPNPAVVPEIGRDYLLNYRTTGQSVGTLTPTFGGATGEVSTASGVYSSVLKAVNTDNLVFTANSTHAGNIDSVSIIPLD
ncbi:MAG: hypothetical protein ACK4U0_19225 [Mesorhizobium sp.]